MTCIERLAYWWSQKLGAGGIVRDTDLTGTAAEDIEAGDPLEWVGGEALVRKMRPPIAPRTWICEHGVYTNQHCPSCDAGLTQ